MRKVLSIGLLAVFVAAGSGCRGYVSAAAVRSAWDVIRDDYVIYLELDKELEDRQRRTKLRTVELLDAVLEEGGSR